MAHFYLNELLEAGTSARLEGPEARHAVTVSRLAVGERVSIGNGRGLIVSGPITLATPTLLEIEVERTTEAVRASPAIVLAQALAKGDRDELAIQAATELGVDAVIPWQAARSISRWEGSKVAKGLDRWTAVVREATKQSIRAWIPDVLDLATTKQLARLAAETRMLVLEPTATQSLADVTLDARDLVLVVGPEGGVSPAELAALTEAGATTVSLGDNVLRTSTAGPAAIAVLNARLARW
ncbi:16S rRNA (uracil(1498)-N(3))-methyltransferase [soil metagenome]